MPAGLIEAVHPHSLAERAGLRAGDALLAINGHQLRDVIDVRFYAAEPYLALEARRASKTFTRQVERRFNEPLGLSFTEPTFDGIRRCNNRCEFCFVDQMPPGLRPSLYLKDDDYRYSFLHGTYITLTNLTATDWARIEEQHLSPLYVSVHATKPALRRRYLRNPDAPDVLDQLRRLTEIGVEVHTQIVVRPGINDRAHLDRSIADLVAYYPDVRSLSVVPVGLTKYHRGDCRLLTLDEMEEVSQQVLEWQTRLREDLSAAFAYLSDEWYLRLGETVPPLTAYDGLDLTENGVGLVRRFLNTEVDQLRDSHSSSPATLVTGTLFAPTLSAALKDTPVEVFPVVNRFFGQTVTVAGLLTAQDVIEQLPAKRLNDVVVLPAAMFGGPEGQSLDEMWPEDVATTLDRPVEVNARVFRP